MNKLTKHYFNIYNKIKVFKSTAIIIIKCFKDAVKFVK